MPNAVSFSFTVVVPAYNPGPFLREALESVQQQTVGAAWTVVVDDGSSDGTGETAQSLLDELELPGEVIRQANQGISAARNAGLAHRRTDWVALLDADDLWLPDHLERLQTAIGLCPEAVVAFGDSRFFGDSRSMTGLLTRGIANKLSERLLAEGVHLLSDRVFDELLPGLFIPVSASAFRTDLAPSPRFDIGLHSGEDRYFFLQMSRRGRFVFTEHQISKTRRHEHNTTHHFNAARLHGDLVTLLKKIERTDDFRLTTAQRGVVRAAATKAADALMYSSSRSGLQAYVDARREAAAYLPVTRRYSLRDTARALAVTLGLKKAEQAERP